MHNDSPLHAEPTTVVIVPCGGKKLDVPAPAGELYTGSYHRAARRAADALTTNGGRVLILSALHGLVPLDQMLAPYELRAGQPGTVSAETLRAQAAALGIDAYAHITVLGGRAYVELAAQVWPTLTAPLAGTRGIGEQMARLAAIYKPTPAAPSGIDHQAAHQKLQTRRAEQADRETRRRAAYVVADTLRIDHHGRASARFTFPQSTGKTRTAARAAAAHRFAAAYNIATDQLDPATLEASGTPEQVARFASALPRLIELAEGYATLAGRTYGRWERHSSAQPHLEGVDATERRALTRRFRAESFDVVVSALLNPTRPVPQPDEAAPMWEQADTVAAAITSYGWFDITSEADPAEVTHLLETALIDAAPAPGAPVPVALNGVRLLAPRPAHRTTTHRTSRPARRTTTRPAPKPDQLHLFAAA
ncbi:hypothetical protein GCM10022252_74950 [Streptosporangium oxazolinicum]|uniref:DUF6884 domain-containing protein n=1 Tax=Streptosporangium oxazolinicum TaxID=909287 RepID=A0ABP8BKL1_9ACTN